MNFDLVLKSTDHHQNSDDDIEPTLICVCVCLLVLLFLILQICVCVVTFIFLFKGNSLSPQVTLNFNLTEMHPIIVKTCLLKWKMIIFIYFIQWRKTSVCLSLYPDNMNYFLYIYICVCDLCFVQFCVVLCLPFSFFFKKEWMYFKNCFLLCKNYIHSTKC